MKSKIALVTLLLLYCFININAQNPAYFDTVFLNYSVTIPCKILETSLKEITILFGDSSITKINTENIDNYKFGDIKTYKKNKRTKFHQYANNTVFFEGFGNGIYYSINYDRILYRNYNTAISIRIGYTQYKTGCLLPIELNFLGKSRMPGCFAELGFGYTPLVWADNNMSAISSRIGFRYQQPDGGLFFRVAFLPIYKFPSTEYNDITGSSSSDGVFLPWYGVSIGYTIQK